MLTMILRDHFDTTQSSAPTPLSRVHFCSFERRPDRAHPEKVPRLGCDFCRKRSTRNRRIDPRESKVKSANLLALLPRVRARQRLPTAVLSSRGHQAECARFDDHLKIASWSWNTLYMTMTMASPMQILHFRPWFHQEKFPASHSCRFERARK